MFQVSFSNFEQIETELNKKTIVAPHKFFKHFSQYSQVMFSYHITSNINPKHSYYVVRNSEELWSISSSNQRFNVHILVD